MNMESIICGGTAGRFVLARNGKPEATIVIARDATPAACFGAAELQYHIQKITDAVLPVVTDNIRVQGRRILVGESAATEALGLDSHNFKSQGYLIRFLPDTLVLMGKDTETHDATATRPARVQGKFGNALQFDGVKDVFTVLDCGFSDDVGTLETWVWMPAESQKSSPGTILRLEGVEPWSYHIIQCDKDSNCISYITHIVHNNVDYGGGLTSPNLAAGWHHVLGTHDLNTRKMELFVDGVSYGTTDYVRTACKGTMLSIGGYVEETGAVRNPFKGSIDEVRISKVVRDVNNAAIGGPYAVDANTTCLFHFDEAAGPCHDAAAAEVGGVERLDLFGENSTLYAVYDFLERFCAVRWYAPTALGLVYPRETTLEVCGEDVAHTPFMSHRWIAHSAHDHSPVYMPGPPARVSEKDAHLWKLRMRMGGQAFSFYGYYERFLKDHPDWFAQGYKDKDQMCYTNSAFIDQVIQDARDYFDGKGDQPGAAAMGSVFGLAPMDNTRWCKCASCQAQLNQAEMGNQHFNNGKASYYIFNFVNRVAQEVYKTHPDKWLGTLAYSDYAYYPEQVALSPNIIVQMCLHTRNWWCPSMAANDQKVLNDWRKKEPKRQLYLWLYYLFPAANARDEHYNCFPGFFAHTVVSQMKMYQEARIKGIFMDHSSEVGQTYLMDQLEFYVTLKLADNPNLDGNQLIDEFFTRYYGAAALPMQELYGKIEETFSNPQNYPVAVQTSPHQHQNEALAWGWLGTEQRMTEFGELMAQAREAAQTPVEKERVALFERGIWDYMHSFYARA